MSDNSSYYEEHEETSDASDQSEEAPDLSHLSEATRLTYQKSVLVFRNLDNLMDKCTSAFRASDDGTEATTDTTVTREELFDQVESTLLPQLDEKLKRLTSEFKPDVEWEDLDEKFETLLAIQTELDPLLAQIASAKDRICRSDTEPDLTNDQGFKKLKHIRISGMQEKLRLLITEHVHSSFRYCRWLLGEILSDSYDVPFLGGVYLADFNELHITFASLYHSGFSRENRQQHKAELLEVARAAMLITKLTRILIEKLYKQVTLKNSLPFFIEISSAQIKTLQDLPHCINNYLCRIKGHLNPATRISFSLETITSSSKDFQICFDLLINHLVPSIINTDGFETRKYFEDWLNTWNDQRVIVSQNLELALKSLKDVRN
ncbi:hypothetical protein PSTT_00809 [Puccinia striiformis]|uniref:Uncharacterized protein n=1 Tax=Puccinia striiformis TaxID=27350 RepID=A0A2S4W5Q5_9BASI|nr:hypothetical protein PSTT_00809 [Puccinia striiformis]